jgi:predicted dehydrogenase
MSNRREFISKLAGGAALAAGGLSVRGLAAETTASAAPGLQNASAAPGVAANARILGANDRVRYGLIGCGGRGQAIFKAALRSPNTEAVAVADVYTRRLDQAGQIAPQVKTYSDFRRLLDDKTIDAVLIATPQHQHALNFVPAIRAGKDVYQEKTMAFNPDHARRMRRAFVGSGRVVQVGIQSTSTPAVQQAKDLLAGNNMGTITAIVAHMYRNAPYGGWKRKIPPDCDTQHVDWRAFEGETAPHDFDANRYMNWRFFWDYSGGNVFENMVHQVGFWYKVMGLEIPRAVTMTGRAYQSPGMEVPDTMDVSMDLPQNLLFSWNSGFHSSFYGHDEQVLGEQGTVVRLNEVRLSYVPGGRRHRAASPQTNQGSGRPDIVNARDATLTHMTNFFDCVRSRREPDCPFELGYRSAIACQMSITSYMRRRTVTWDAEREDII